MDVQEIIDGLKEAIEYARDQCGGNCPVCGDPFGSSVVMMPTRLSPDHLLLCEPCAEGVRTTPTQEG